MFPTLTMLWNKHYAGALAGNYAAFDGRELRVRNAGEDAWLMREAPHVPELDDPPERLSINAFEELKLLEGCTAADKVAAAQMAQDLQVAQKQRTSFRSIREAMEHASDGDRIIVERGPHNTTGESILLTKRVLIRGEGQLGTLERILVVGGMSADLTCLPSNFPGEAVQDQRGNSQMFRITSHCVIQNLQITQSGFCHTIHVEKSAKPIFENCVMKNDGDDAVTVFDHGYITLRHCSISECKKAGMSVYQSGRATMVDCMIR